MKGPSLRNILGKACSVFIPLCIFLVLFEISARAFLSNELDAWFVTDERNLAYNFDEYLGWFPKAGFRGQLQGAQTTLISNNVDGFRDHEYDLKTKPRIVFLGDSFVWGYDVDFGRRFTEILQDRLPAYEIMNWGISGYGTDQEYLLLEKYFERFKPDIVVLVFNGANDRQDNSTNFRYLGYFKPLFGDCAGQLCVSNYPVPKSLKYYFGRFETALRYSYFLRALGITIFNLQSYGAKYVPDPTEKIMIAMKDFVQNRHARFIVGLANSDPTIVRFLKEKNWEFVSLENGFVYSSSGNHWTEQGHAFVADSILGVIKIEHENKSP